MKTALVVMTLGLAACVPTAPAENPPDSEFVVYMPEPDPGFPPKMGDISGVADGKAVAWQTYDFSIGAFDASAWVGFRDGVQTLHLRGLPPGQPRSETGEIFVTGDIPGARTPGALVKVVVVVPTGKDRDGPGLSSVGQKATLQIDKIAAPAVDASGYGHVSGRMSAMLCPVNGAKGGCQAFAASFATEVQFDATQFETAR